MENEKFGSETYMPSRLEWLTIFLNSRYKLGNYSVNRFKLSFSIGDDDRTINVNIRYFGDLNVNTLEELKEFGREAVLSSADQHGWEDWVQVKINEELVPMERANN